MTGDRIARALRSVHTSTLANTTIEVFEPTETYEAGDGFTVTYPSDPAAVYPARVVSPAARADRDAGGTTAELDAVVVVRDDTGQVWTDFTDEREAPVEFVDTADDTRYEVQRVIDPLIDTGTLRASIVAVRGDDPSVLPGEAEFSGFDSDSQAPPSAGRGLIEEAVEI